MLIKGSLIIDVPLTMTTSGLKLFIFSQTSVLFISLVKIIFSSANESVVSFRLFFKYLLMLFL